MNIILLIPSILDSLRVSYGVRFMGLYTVTLFLAIWLTKAFAGQALRIQYSSTYILLGLLAATAFLSTTSPLGSPLEKLYRAVSFSYTRLLIVVLLINAIRSRDDIRRTLYMVIGVGAGSAVVALWQFWMYEQAGINYSFAQGEQIFRVSPRGTFLRATALAVDPNEIGIIMAVAAIWCLYLGLSTEGFRWIHRLGHYLLFIILVGGVIVTFSRSALLSLFIGVALLCVAIAFVDRRASMRRVARALGVLVIGATGAFSIFLSIFEEASEDVLWRMELNRLGLRAVAENPVTGVGIDGFASYDNAFDVPVHNLFLQVAAELGFPGVFFFVILLGYILVRLVRAVRTVDDSKSHSVLMAVTLGYVTQLVSHMSNPILTDLFFWFGVGLSEAAISAHRSGIGPGERALKAQDQ